MSLDEAMTKVVVADGHRLFREAIVEILQAQPGVDVVGAADDGVAAVGLIAGLQPDVVLLDVEVPGADIVLTVGRIRRVAPRASVVVLSTSDDARLVERLIAVEVDGYLLKSVSRHELVATVLGADPTGGRITVSVSRATLRQFRLAELTTAAGDYDGLLSEREQVVLDLTAEALSNAQIATRLNVTEAVVKRHLRRIFQKLGAVSRIDAVNRAMAAGMLSVRSGDPRPPPQGQPGVQSP